MKKPILIFLIFIILVSGIVITIKKIDFPAISFLNSKKTEENKTQPKVSYDAIGGKITLKYKDLNLFFTECCDSFLKNVRTSEEGGEIKAVGEATFPFPAYFQAKMTLTVLGGKIKPSITELSLGKIQSPQMLKDKIQDQVQKSLDDNINSKYRVKDVKIKKEGILIEIN